MFGRTGRRGQEIAVLLVNEVGIWIGRIDGLETGDLSDLVGCSLSISEDDVEEIFHLQFINNTARQLIPWNDLPSLAATVLVGPSYMA